jgi:hypothetical protein
MKTGNEPPHCSATGYLQKLLSFASSGGQQSPNLLHLDRFAKAIVIRGSYTERLHWRSFANSNSRSID